MKIQGFLRVNFQSKCPSSYFILSLFILAFGVLGLMFVFSIGPLNEKIGSPIFDLRPMGYSYEEALYILSQLDDEWRSFYLFPQLFLFEAKYDEILDIKFDNYQRFLIQHNGKYGIIDQKGEIIIPPEYDYFLEMKYSYNSNQGMALKKAEQWYYYSLRKDEIKLAPKNLLPRIRKLMVKPRE